MYTVNGTASRAVSHGSCLLRGDLDFPASASYMVLTLASKEYLENVKELLASLTAVPQKGRPPELVVVGNLGLTEEQIQSLRAVSSFPVEFPSYGDVLRELNEFDPDLKRSTGKFFPESFAGGGTYRLKAVVMQEWFEKRIADQLIWLDAGGVMLGSMHRVRNFAASEGFYAGTLTESALSGMFSQGGFHSLAEQKEMQSAMSASGSLPTCFDFEKDNLVDNTLILSTENGDGGPVGQNSSQLGSFESGFIVLDSRHKWVDRLLKRWSENQADDKLWLQNFGHFFAWDQKLLTNFLWNEVVCQESAAVHLLDIDNVRFGMAVQWPHQIYKGRKTFDRSLESVPWGGYAYHYCMKPGKVTREEFVVSVTRPSEGLDVDTSVDGSALRVATIRDNVTGDLRGPIVRYNGEAEPPQKVYVGDYIVSVNNNTGDAAKLSALMSSEEHLDLLVRRLDDSLVRHPCMAPADWEEEPTVEWPFDSTRCQKRGDCYPAEGWRMYAITDKTETAVQRKPAGPPLTVIAA